MTKKDMEIAKELKEKLSKVVDLVDFRVFGSRARGDQDEYSDLDIFIEVENLDKKIIMKKELKFDRQGNSFFIPS